MLIKILLEFFKNNNYYIVREDITTSITVVDLKSKMNITHTITGKTILSFNNNTDIRFIGKIENLQQLKMVIKLVSTLPLE